MRQEDLSTDTTFNPCYFLLDSPFNEHFHTFAEIAIVDYRFSFADQGKTNFRFPLVSFSINIYILYIQYFYASGCCDLASNSTLAVSLTDAWQGEEITVVITAN